MLLRNRIDFLDHKLTFTKATKFVSIEIARRSQERAINDMPFSMTPVGYLCSGNVQFALVKGWFTIICNERLDKNVEAGLCGT